MKNPVVRLIARALVAGAAAFVAQLQASESWDAALLRSALIAAVLAAVEVLTPVNAVVGAWKKP